LAGEMYLMLPGGGDFLGLTCCFLGWLSCRISEQVRQGRIKAK